MSEPTASTLTKLQQGFEGLTQREKLMILVAGLAVILLLGFVLFVEPMLKDIQKNQRDVQRMQTELSGLQQSQIVVEQELRQDPNIALRARITSLAEDVAKLDEYLANQTRDLVPADKMPALLERVLGQSDKLTLLELKSIPPTQLLVAENDKSKNTVSGNNLYQHGVQLRPEGSYFDIQQYLHDVEAMPWRFYWKSFQYSVADYPTAQVQIELYTLSTSQAFIGVMADD